MSSRSNHHWLNSNTSDDDDFVNDVLVMRRSMQSRKSASPVSFRVTRSRSHKAQMDENIANKKGKDVVSGGSWSGSKRKRDFGKRPQHYNFNIDEDPKIKIRKDFLRKGKSVKSEYDRHPHGGPSSWKTWNFYTPREKHAYRSVSTHTNNKIASEFKKILTGGLLERFKSTCFGHFLDMPIFEVQNQLLVALLFREVVRPSHDALWFIINGKKLKFGLKEFALITGLKCEGDFLKDYSSKKKNRLVQTYFPGVKRVSKTQLSECFKKKMWQNDDDAIKIAVLYFISTFLYSTKNNRNRPHLIPKEHFEIVESGDWEIYPWGTKVFLATIESLHDKVRVWHSSYRFAGLPYALLVWFYECCPTADGELANRVGDHIPRILNWEVTRYLGFDELQTGFFRLTDCKMVLDNITPTELEMSTLQLPPDEEHEDPKDIPVESNDDIPKNDASGEPVVDNAEFVRREHFIKELELIKKGQLDLKKDLHSVTQQVYMLNDFIVATADRIFLELDEIKKKVSAKFDPKDGGMEANFSFGGFGPDHEVCDEDAINTNEVTCVMKDTIKETIISVGGAIGDDSKGTSRETTPSVVGKNGDMDEDDSDFSKFSAQDFEKIDEICRSAGKGSAERKFVVNAAPLPKALADVCLDDHGQSEFPNFKLLDSQDFGEIFHDAGFQSAEANKTNRVFEQQCKPVFDKTPLNESNGKYTNDVASVEGSNSVIVDGYQAQAAYDKTPLIEPTAEDGAEMFLNQSFQDIFMDHLDEQVEGQPDVVTRDTPTDRTPPDHVTLAKKVFFSFKHPFTTNIWRRVDSGLLEKFTEWIKIGLRKNREEPYRKNANILKPKFDFSVCLVVTKDWFHSLHHADNAFDETHIDVILYYLRKRAKYDHRVRARFTTTDSLFDSILRDMYNNYLENNKSLTVAANNHIISDYMKGLSMRYNIPWRLVDNVLFPIKVVKDWHWVLARLSFRDRILYVYDQKLDNYYYDRELIEVVEAYAILIPLFLSAIGFYDSRNDLNIKAYEFGAKPRTDPFQVLHVYDMTRVRKADYGVFAATFAEHFIHGRGMPEKSCNINRFRKRYGALLWDYGLHKQVYNAESDPEE